MSTHGATPCNPHHTFVTSQTLLFFPDTVLSDLNSSEKR